MKRTILLLILALGLSGCPNYRDPVGVDLIPDEIMESMENSETHMDDIHVSGRRQ